MPLLPASSPTDPAFLAPFGSATDVLHELLAISLTGVIFYTPLYDPAGSGEIIDFAFEYLNATAQRMMRMSERPTCTHLEQWPHSKEHGTFDFHVQAFVIGEPRHYAINYQADGYNNYYHLAARRVGAGLLVSFTDTADQPRSPVELALREAQAAEQAARADAEAQRQRLYQVLMDLPAQVATYYGSDHVYTLVNQRYQAYFPRHELLGYPVREAFPETAAQGFLARLEHVYVTGEPYYGHEEVVNLDFTATGRDQQVFINTFYHPLRNAQGEVDGVLDFSYDVTEQVLARRQVERLNQELETQVQERTQQLVQQSARLGRLLQEAPAAICMLDGPEMVFELVNPSYQQLFPDRILLGKPVLVGLPELAGGPVETILRGVYQTGVTFEGNEVLMSFARPSDGQLEDRYFNLIYQARYDAAGAIDGLVIFAFEVSVLVQGRHQTHQLNEVLAVLNEELQVTNQALHRTNMQLRHTNVDLDTFVYAASHDLKAPIANIEGLLDALREYLPPEDHEPMVARLVSMMQGAITRFQQTVGHLNAISRLQLAPEEPAEALDLTRVLEEALLDLLPLLESTRAQVHSTVTDCPSSHFSTKDLRSILFNLLSNAVKYRAPDRTPLVQVRTQCTDKHLVLTVQDNGLGLSEQQQSQLFTMFRRLHTHVEGSGVGLYLIKRLIENAGGTITVYSQLGLGSTFTVTLPLASC
ncbi:sensor histidine kinase [Hymenobacter crusticola]|uniref:histidine kinase n=1 Tax=Hymenobacter crusticola TaxID=1770526 RepID=A0A243W6N1_9BACT|nr:PAS domain-containing sensor histidine kinase [Hymenobacter crusticola]OUJ69816.1 hypothetical protein BXP70_25930 [Hymenobacter crusticola]